MTKSESLKSKRKKSAAAKGGHSLADSKIDYRSQRRSPCPVACSLDIFGDKWCLLIVRDMFWGKKIYSEFLLSPESIPTNILADRLKRLTDLGLVAKQAYQTNPIRYQYLLTDTGKSLGPVLKAIKQWGLAHIPDTYSAGS